MPLQLNARRSTPRAHCSFGSSAACSSENLSNLFRFLDSCCWSVELFFTMKSLYCLFGVLTSGQNLQLLQEKVREVPQMEITTLLHLLKQLMTTKETFEVCKLNLMGWTWKETISRWVSKFKLHTRSTRAIFHKGSDINYLMLKQNLKLRR